MLKHGFMLETTQYDALKKIIAKDLNKLREKIPEEDQTPDRFFAEFSKPHGVNNVAALPTYAQDVVKAMVPKDIRHMLVFSNKKPLGRREFAVHFFENVKSTLKEPKLLY